MLATIAWVSIAVAFGCALTIVVDEVRHPQAMGIMNVVWPLTALYLSVFAVVGYFWFGRSKSGHQHQHGMSEGMEHGHGGHMPMGGGELTWKQIALAASHCGAGCALGDVISEFGIHAGGVVLFGSPLGTSYVVDLVVAWVLGIVFQYYSIQPMRHLPPLKALGEAMKADTLSIVSFQVGMYAWMALTYFVLYPEPHLTAVDPLFWLMMQVAMVFGFLTTAPMNRWLVRRGIKEAMG